MKTSLYLCALLWLCCLTVQAQTLEYSSHIVRYPQKLNTQDFVFMTERIGLQALQLGNLVRTTDSGNSWNAIQLPYRYDIRSLCSPTPAVALAVGQDGAVFRSQDTGATWQYLSMIDASFSPTSLLSVKEDVVIAYGDSSRGYISSDRGMTWQRMQMPMYQKCFVAATKTGVLLLVADSTQFWTSHDIGRTWKNVTVDIGTRRVRSISACAQSTFIVCGTESLLLRTENGGETWTVPKRTMFSPDTTIMYNFSLLGMNDEGFGALLTRSVFTFRTNLVTYDFGATWTEMYLYREGQFSGISPKRQVMNNTVSYSFNIGGIIKNAVYRANDTSAPRILTVRMPELKPQPNSTLLAFDPLSQRMYMGYSGLPNTRTTFTTGVDVSTQTAGIWEPVYSTNQNLSSSGVSQSQRVYKLQLPKPNTIHLVLQITEAFGASVKNLYTTDGGRSWIVLQPTIGDPNGELSVNSSGVVVGLERTKGSYLYSWNEGKDWERKNLPEVYSFTQLQPVQNDTFILTVRDSSNAVYNMISRDGLHWQRSMPKTSDGPFISRFKLLPNGKALVTYGDKDSVTQNATENIWYVEHPDSQRVVFRDGLYAWNASTDIAMSPTGKGIVKGNSFYVTLDTGKTWHKVKNSYLDYLNEKVLLGNDQIVHKTQDTFYVYGVDRTILLTVVIGSNSVSVQESGVENVGVFLVESPYPNPAKQKFTSVISWAYTTNPSTLRAGLYNSTGEKVRDYTSLLQVSSMNRTTQIECDVQDLPSGVYYFYVVSDKQSVTRIINVIK